MKQSTFFITFLIITAFTALLIISTGQWPLLQNYMDISWISLALFALICLAMFFGALSAVKNKNKNSFITAIMGFTTVKLILAAIVIFAYHQIAEPATNFFILPFFVIYFIYTAFELYFMMKVGKMNA